MEKISENKKSGYLQAILSQMRGGWQAAVSNALGLKIPHAEPQEAAWPYRGTCGKVHVVEQVRNIPASYLASGVLRSSAEASVRHRR